jgi:hypothetical protein
MAHKSIEVQEGNWRVSSRALLIATILSVTAVVCIKTITNYSVPVQLHAVMSGRIVDAVDGQPVKGARIWGAYSKTKVQDIEWRKDAENYYREWALPGGEHISVTVGAYGVTDGDGNISGVMRWKKAWERTVADVLLARDAFPRYGGIEAMWVEAIGYEPRVLEMPVGTWRAEYSPETRLVTGTLSLGTLTLRRRADRLLNGN